MKRIIAIILIAGISFSSLHLDELTKFSTLVFHYLEHKQTHPETTVLSFLYDHYVTNKKADSARDK